MTRNRRTEFWRRYYRRDFRKISLFPRAKKGLIMSIGCRAVENFGGTWQNRWYNSEPELRDGFGAERKCSLRISLGTLAVRNFLRRAFCYMYARLATNESLPFPRLSEKYLLWLLPITSGPHTSYFSPKFQTDARSDPPPSTSSEHTARYTF